MYNLIGVRICCLKTFETWPYASSKYKLHLQIDMYHPFGVGTGSWDRIAGTPDPLPSHCVELPATIRLPHSKQRYVHPIDLEIWILFEPCGHGGLVLFGIWMHVYEMCTATGYGISQNRVRLEKKRFYLKRTHI